MVLSAAICNSLKILENPTACLCMLPLQAHSVTTCYNDILYSCTYNYKRLGSHPLGTSQYPQASLDSPRKGQKNLLRFGKGEMCFLFFARPAAHTD